MTEFTHPPDWRWLIGLGAVGAIAIALSYAFARGRAGAVVRTACTLLRLLSPLRLALLLSQPLRLRTYPLELCREFGINERAPGAS